MNVRVLQHVPFEGLGCIEGWLEQRKAQIEHTRFFQGELPPPSPDGIDLVIAMGGPMSVNDEEKLPWLRAEKQFVRDSIARDIPVLGICLGAQLIASALGARVTRNPVKEIGWFPIQSVSLSENGFSFPSECMVFHWHGETFDLPKGAIRLAGSPGCSNQAFLFKRNVIGLQFHLEVTPQSVRDLVKHCGDEIVENRFVQSATTIEASPANFCTNANILMRKVLSFLTGLPG